ncbi:MAG: protein-L-isoaspartate(D-aspartate) O-methyltransferase [Chloroflexi bacterium]|nr:protein-L-isoaspartate(D-aspartate) O-methyltransferase [Chloroflexota bacterium]
MTNLAEARQRLLEELGRSIRDQRVLEAMARVPRERFVPPGYQEMAYEDVPLPIGEGQTISQPFIVALMTQALRLSGAQRVLEVGTGSGYQAAILGHLARQVVTVERYADLADAARARLGELGIANVEVQVAGAKLGWPAGAPYDAIIVTAAAPAVPQGLLDQLKNGGIMVIPVGPRDHQDLLVVTKHGDRIGRRSLGGCRFVPLVGEEAWLE